MNKITKLLSVFIIAGAIGTGVAGVAGCNNGGGNSGNGGGGDGVQHTASHELKYTDNQNGTSHKVTCKVEGCDFTEIPNEGHVDENNDRECDLCEGAVTGGQTQVTVTITTTATDLVVGKTLTLEATVTPAGTAGTIVWEITSGSEKATLEGNVLTGVAAGDVTVKAHLKDGESNIASSGAKTINVVSAGKYDELAASDDCIVDSAELFATAGAVTATPVSGTKGVYTIGSSDNTKIEDGVVSTNGGVYIDFGTTSDIIEGNMVINITKTSSNAWTLFRLAGAVGAEQTKELFGIKSDGKYRFNGLGSTETSFEGNNYQNKVDYEITFLYNKVTNTLKVQLKNDQSVTVYDGVVELAGTIQGVSIHTREAADTATIKKIAVVTRGLSDAEYVAATKTTVATYNTSAIALKGENWAASGTEDALGSAKLAADSALEGATTKTAADEALATYKEAVHSALATEYLARLQAAYPKTNYTTGPDNEDGDEYNTKKYSDAVAAANTAFGAVETLGGFATVYAAQIAIFAEIPTNALLQKANVTLSISDGTSVVATLTVKDGVNVTKDMLDAEVYKNSAVTGKKVYSYKTGSLTGTNVAFPYAATAVDSDSDGTKDDTTVTIYAELLTAKTTTVSVAAGVEANGQNKDKGYLVVEGDTGTTVEITDGLSDNKTDIKYKSNDYATTITVNAVKGQIILLTITGYTGSTNNAVTAKATATGATLVGTDGTDNVIEFSATSAAAALENGTIAFTADATGTVTITLKRNNSKTVRVTGIMIDVLGDGETA